jgi:Xaa-Pro dipeptidase
MSPLTRRSFIASAACLPAAAAVLPPPIAALKDRRGEAKPITAEERLTRMERARELMRANQIGAICLAGGTSLTYFSGIHWYNSERLFVMLLPARGAPFFVCPAFEEARSREQIAQRANLKDAQVYPWQENENPYALVASCLKERGLGSGRIGFEEGTPFVFTTGISAAAPAATFVSATPVTAGCRMVKSPAELALMRLACDVTWHVYEAAWRSVREGMTNRELSALIPAAYDRVGFPGEAMVEVNESSSLPHGSARPQTIRDGSIVLLDDGCTVEGYQSDITRTFVFGKPTEKMKRVFDIVRRAQDAALAAARPGVPCENVDAAARKVITDAGFGPDYKYFVHRVGHGIGMDGHEWPYLVRGDKLPLAANMTFSDEPGIYIPGEFGIRLEDDMHITESGAELLTPQSPSLEHPFAT